MKGYQKNCITLIIDVCNNSLDRFKSVLNEMIRKVGFGGALRVLVYKCRELDFNRYIRELNAVMANNYTVTVLVYEFDDLNELIKEVSKDVFGKCSSVNTVSTIELPAGINYEKLNK